MSLEMIDNTGEKRSLRYCSVDYRPKPLGEPGSRETMTEQTYIPLKDQVEAMIAAGRNLELYRKELYHYQAGDEIDENEDPGDPYSQDPAEISQIQLKLLAKRERLARLKREQDEKEQLKLDLVVTEGAKEEQGKVLKKGDE